MSYFNIAFSVAWLILGVTLHRNDPAAMIGCFIMSELLWQRAVPVPKESK